MPTQLQIQNSILSGQLLAANISDANRVQLQGANEVDWGFADSLLRNVAALQRQYNLNDYTSDGTLAVYECLNSLIGYDPEVNVIDPNYQPPSGVIIIVETPGDFLPPVDLYYSYFDPASTQPDSGRITYLNPEWKGLNPMVQLAQPGLVALFLGKDYTLVPSGGITLLAGGNYPEIYDGDILRVTGYETT